MHGGTYYKVSSSVVNGICSVSRDCGVKVYRLPVLCCFPIIVRWCLEMLNNCGVWTVRVRCSSARHLFMPGLNGASFRCTCAGLVSHRAHPHHWFQLYLLVPALRRGWTRIHILKHIRYQCFLNILQFIFYVYLEYIAKLLFFRQTFCNWFWIHLCEYLVI